MTAVAVRPGPVVTGLGVVAPNGFGAEEYWRATLAGTSGIERLTRFDPAPYRSRLAGEIRGFDPARHLPSRLVPQTDHVTRLSLVATEEARWSSCGAGAAATSARTSRLPGSMR